MEQLVLRLARKPLIKKINSYHLKQHLFCLFILSLDLNTYGLINYWPIKNSSINDIVGLAHMTYGPNVSLTSDRFNSPNSALNFQSGFNTVPIMGFILMVILRLLFG